mmetsp:Transcript_1966/g.3594  ORF Transcript_1966/g.3594 Transcript_1966/m.3594 type:complete len:151 (+) Transcript_1966:107-559(+)
MSKQNLMYVRAEVSGRNGTDLMRQIAIPTFLLKISASSVNLKGKVVAGHVFWHNGNSSWDASRCLLCFKEETELEMMICDERTSIFKQDLREVFISLSHVVRSILNFDNVKAQLPQQLKNDASNLPLKENLQCNLKNFVAFAAEETKMAV